MTRFIHLAAAALVLSGSAALAQGQPDPGRTASESSRAPRFDRGDYDALLDARVAAVQAGLRLSDEQRRLWQPVEQAYRALAAERADRWEERRSGRRDAADDRADYVQRLEQRATQVSARAERLRAYSAALQPFWAALDERQRRLLPTLLRPSFRLADNRRGERPEGRHHHGMGYHGRGDAPRRP